MYPGIINKREWQWDEWTRIFTNEASSAGISNLTNQKENRKVSSGILIFPDIVLSGHLKSAPVKNNIKNKIPQISTKSIILQAGKFPGRLKKSPVSSKPLSKQVSKILTMLMPVTLLNALPEEKNLSLNRVQLKEYRKQLEVFISERWEVPLHLIESKLTAEIKFEITKNGRLLSWSMEESSNKAFNKSVKNLLKNLQFLPSLPESYPEDSYKFGVRFTPTNLQL
uniref:TonB C-terminal domain-containing protein n=1 Tax=uncultured delta proteobacterium HF0130_20J24 TaxID=710829 RepID=E0XXQ1_9DELT|nr:hypothetical protein [uncultured delta proteobacterium HF0130_20J24]